MLATEVKLLDVIAEHMNTQCIFPAELISQIFYHTDPPDIVRWRTVSKWFRTLTYDRVLWKNLYADAPFPRPPGPFPSQSNASLERNLVKSAQLAESWTTRPMRDVSWVKIKLKGEPTMPPKLIHGRWLIACELGRRFVLHDTETGAQRVLWEQDKPEVSSWDVCSMESLEGQCVVYVLLKLESRSYSVLSGWKLLEFRLNDGSGELVDSAVIDGPADKSLCMAGREALRAGKSPFLSMPISSGHLVFDTRTRVFYELPEFHIALDETFGYIGRDSYLMGTQIAFTDTYIISLGYFHKHASVMDLPTVIQVFTLPLDESTVKNGNRVLCLTHEGVVEDFQGLNVDVLKPLIDPITGATYLRLLDYTSRRCELQVTRIDLTLREPSADDVSPMSVEMRHYRLPKEGMPTNHYRTRFQYVDISEEGHVRGFYRGYRGIPNDHVMKFTIDTRQDEWIINCGKLVPAEWSHLGNTWLGESIMFDGMRGKICFSDPKNCQNIVVVDIE